MLRAIATFKHISLYSFDVMQVKRYRKAEYKGFYSEIEAYQYMAEMAESAPANALMSPEHALCTYIDQSADLPAMPVISQDPPSLLQPFPANVVLDDTLSASSGSQAGVRRAIAGHQHESLIDPKSWYTIVSLFMLL